ncbi:EpsG family protein, partial [Cetobacterium sp.]|uniref:EpsG family protein n=1 Tax=Cetobacterium sp. TaxID=2071632 RepID=UPI003EE65389
MNLYLLIQLILILIFIKSYKSNNKKYYIGIIYIVICLFCGLTYNNGSDWPNYQRYFENISFDNFSNIKHEKLFLIYLLVMKNIFIRFNNFYFINMLFLISSYLVIIKKFPKKIQIFSFILFYFYLGTSLIDGALRQQIATALFYRFGILNLKKNTSFFLIIIIIISFFHKSALALIFLPFALKYIKINIRKMLIIYLILLFINQLEISNYLLNILKDSYYFIKYKNSEY